MCLLSKIGSIIVTASAVLYKEAPFPGPPMISLRSIRREEQSPLQVEQLGLTAVQAILAVRVLELQFH